FHQDHWSNPQESDAMLDTQPLHETVGVFTKFTKCWTTIASEMTDYKRRSLDDGSATFAKMVSAKSVEDAVAIQTEYAKRAYDAHLKLSRWRRSVCGSAGHYLDAAKATDMPLFGTHALADALIHPIIVRQQRRLICAEPISTAVCGLDLPLAE